MVTFLGQDQRQPSYSCRLREQQKRQHWKESQGCGRQGSPTWHAECSCLCQLSWSHSIVSPPALQWQQHLAAVTKIIFSNFIAIWNIGCTLHTLLSPSLLWELSPAPPVQRPLSSLSPINKKIYFRKQASKSAPPPHKKQWRNQPIFWYTYEWTLLFHDVEKLHLDMSCQAWCQT